MSNVYSFFNVSTADGVSFVEFNRPSQLNAMNTAFWVELPQLIRALDAEGKTRVAVLHGAGRLFSAGIDVSMFGGDTALTTESVSEREAFKQQLIALQRTLEVLAQARFPVIAAVHGACIGAGVDLITACCLRYATRDAYFCIEEINLGMMADVGTLQRIPKQLSDAVVRELAYTGDKLGAERAERLGFVNAIFDNQELMMDAVRAVAKKIASKSPIAVAGTKKMVSYSRDHSVAESFEMLNAMQPAIFSSADIQRAMIARRLKEMPEFADLPPIAPPIAVGQ